MYIYIHIHTYTYRYTPNPTEDEPIIQTLRNPITPVGSLLRMDEVNHTRRAGTKMRNHNIEIWGG